MDVWNRNIDKEVIMICPKCEAKGVEERGTRVKEDHTDTYCTCHSCGFRFIVRRPAKISTPIVKPI